MDGEGVLDEVFEQIVQNVRIFKNRDVLRHDYIPERLPHREEQIRRVGEVVAPVLRNARCSNLFIYGKTGTGKTAVVKYVLKRLLTKSKEIGVDAKCHYINCRLAGTEYRVFSSLCDAINVKVPFTGLAVGEVFDRFKTNLDMKKILFIIVLDEVDALVKMKGDALLYELTRINENLENSKVSLVGISNDLRFKEFLDSRVLSSLSEEEIVFRPYDAAELKDILMERAKIAFNEDALDNGALNICAALAAAEHGDARRALDLLRVAGEIAERGSAKMVSEEHVREAEKRIEHDRVFEALQNLPIHSKLVLHSVYLLGKAHVNDAVTGDIYEIYSELCSQTALAALTQRRVSGLINELDAIGLLNSRLVNRGRYGRTKKIRLGIASNLVCEAFTNDQRLGRLTEYEPQYLSKHPNSRA